MKSTLDLIFDKITESAKKRFDYEDFKSSFEDLPDYFPDYFLFGVLLGFATGEDESEISLKLFNDKWMKGFMERNQIEEFLVGKNKLFEREIFVMKEAISLLDNGSEEHKVLGFVEQSLD